MRIADVALIGPLMMSAAFSCRRLPKPFRLALMVAGTLTVAYNAENYLRKAHEIADQVAK